MNGGPEPGQDRPTPTPTPGPGHPTAPEHPAAVPPKPTTAPSASPPPSRGRWADRRTLLLLGGVGTLVLALVAGFLLLASSSDTDSPTADGKGAEAEVPAHRGPFEEAVEELAVTPGLQYRDTAVAGITERDVTVTASGIQYGSTDGSKSYGRDVLRIDDKTFTRFRDDPAPDPESADGEEGDVPGRWQVGSLGESDLLDDVLDQYRSPPQLAAELFEALQETDTFPDPKDPGPHAAEIGGVPALQADTPAGRLSVTRTPPHRVLALEPYDLREAAERLRERAEQPEKGAPAELPRVTIGPLADGDSDGLEFSPVTGDDVSDLYETLERQAERLGDASDGGIVFTLDGSGDLSCGPSGCSVAQEFDGELTARAKERVTRGEVTAVMSASITIDGRSAGRCTSAPSTFPVKGSAVSGTLKCSAPEAGPVFASVEARYKAKAEADSRRSGGRPVTYRFPYRANTLVDARALAVTEAKALVDRVRQEAKDAKTCATKQPAPQGGGPAPASAAHLSPAERTTALTVVGHWDSSPVAGSPILVPSKGGCLPALREWSSQRFQFGHHTFLLDKKGMEHILKRHHPKYWDGSVKSRQTFLDSRMSVDDVRKAIEQVMRQNREELIKKGAKGVYPLNGTVDGVEYTLGINRGRVGQFYPK
ncbi:hypothetical protein IF129_22295 [Streptomyces chumphonensis]|uniref:Uncharacterized protein n=1 Tax=Streptomyces chumphonensis TaxID=1214925 RepID=A0A927F4R8_9ACTN|nr:hypothetical protein [Streptomyces chumphonensis]MBD3934281.1 hypothetical protein [Streptomyces chumphonensis]